MTAVLDRLTLDAANADTPEALAGALLRAAATSLRFGRLTLQAWRDDPGCADVTVSLDGKGALKEAAPPLPAETLRRAFAQSARPLRGGAEIRRSGNGANGHGSFSSLLAVPLLSDGSCIGAITLQSRQSGAYETGDEEALALIATRAAPHLGRILRGHAVARSSRGHPLLDQARQIIATSGDAPITDLLTRYATLVAAGTTASCAIGFVSRDGAELLVAVTRDGEHDDALASWLRDALVNPPASIRSRQADPAPLVLDQRDPPADPALYRLVQSAPVQVVTFVPPARAGEWLGGLALAGELSAASDPRACQAIEHIADLVGAAVERAARPRPQSTIDALVSSVLSRLHTSLATDEPLETLLAESARVIADLLAADAVALYLFSDEQYPAPRLIDYGCASEVLAALEAAVGRLGRSPHDDGQPSLCETELFDAATDPTEEPGPLGRHYPCRLTMPIRVAGQLRGVLFLFRRTHRPFAQVDADVARGLAAEIAVALEQKRLLQAERRQREVLATIHNLAKRLNRASSRQVIAEIAVEECASAFGSGKASLHLYEANAAQLVIASAYGLPMPFVTGAAHFPLGEGAFGTAARRQTLAVVEDMRTDPDWRAWRPLTDPHPDLRSAWALPLVAENDDLLGVLTIYHAQPTTPSEGDATLFQLLAHQVAMALDRAQLADRTQDIYRATVASLAAAVDAKDPFTHNHSWQVAEYSRKIAEAMGLPSSEVAIIELAGLLHDVGKIGIPDRVLQKPEKLDPDEWAMMRRHTELGAKILGDNPALAAVVPLVRHHHERYDGRGYPDQLSKDSIPLGAVIVGLADAFDTMISDRPYRRGRTAEQAVAEVERSRGQHFDPRVVDAFLNAVRAGDISVAAVRGSAQRGTTRELRLTRVMGVEARAFGLLQRISAEVSALVDIGRFLERLNELMVAEFPNSLCDVFVRDPETGNLMAIAGATGSNGRQNATLVLAEGQGIVGWVADHGLTQNISDVLEDARHVVVGYRLMRSELAVPLMADGRCVGVLDLKHPDPAAFTTSDQQVLEMVATYVAQAIEVADLHNRLKRQADLDSLTGLFNHRAFYRQLDDEVARAQTSGGQLSLAILDVDGLKAINDSQGHLAGDAMIRRIADVLRSRVRAGDTVARYGGDEFAIIMPQASRATIQARMRAIDHAISEESVREPLPAVSWGIACYPEDGRRATELVGHADAAMYAVKRSRQGRANRAS